MYKGQARLWPACGVPFWPGFPARRFADGSARGRLSRGLRRSFANSWCAVTRQRPCSGDGDRGADLPRNRWKSSSRFPGREIAGRASRQHGVAARSQLVRHYLLPLRSGDVGDAVADLTGVVLGVTLVVVGRRLLR